jgi:hypothetical protein
MICSSSWRRIFPFNLTIKTMTDQAIIEAAARALEKFRQSLVFSPDAESVAKVVLAAVTPMIRADTLEEAAQLADDEDGKYWYAGEHRNMVMLQQHGYEIAAAIRALKEQP